MRYRTRRSQLQQMKFLRDQFAQAEGLPFSDVLSAAMIMQALQAAGVEVDERIYTPEILLWMFLSQVLSADGSCREAVARLIAHQAAHGEEPCSARTGAYCQARARLPEPVFAECRVPCPRLSWACSTSQEKQAWPCERGHGTRRPASCTPIQWTDYVRVPR